LFPLLYLWPRFHERLNRRLYPQRTRFPELLRGLGNEMAACETADAVLDALVHMPTRLCDARGSVAFLFAGVAGPEERVRGSETARVNGAGPLAGAPLVHLARAPRKKIRRAQRTVQRQYTTIREECPAGFDRLDAVLLLPMLHDQNVIGGLAGGGAAPGQRCERAR